jgi:hypothetical protein
MGCSGEEMIGKIFERMNDWRHLPSYQLERRADLLFSLYLPEVLSKRTDTIINQDLIPEFPIRIGTINKNKENINQSKKVDYLALSNDGRKAYLIELKTDNTSITEEQTETLLTACEKSFAELLEGVFKIFKSDSLNSTRRRKYLYFLEKLDQMKQINMPGELKTFMGKDTLRGIISAAEGLKATTEVEKPKPVYILPSYPDKSNGYEEKIDIITFADFIEVIEKKNYNDKVSTQFKKCLDDWAKNEAGRPEKTNNQESK